MRGAGSLAAAAIAVVARLSAQSAPPRAAAPLEPIDAILDAFRTHHVVALGEGTGHGDEQAYAFRLALIRDRRFAATVNDLVVELGSARYQDVIDRFVQGATIPDEALRHVWQDTTQPSVLADSSIYQDFFRAVRTLNATLPRKQRLRVLLGDPPIEWEHVTTVEEFSRWLEQRDSFPADLIRREVLAKGRRALVIYGQMHFQRLNIMSNYDMAYPAAKTLVSILERDAPRSVFTIWPFADLEKLQANVASWPAPSLAAINRTVLGAADFAAYRPENETRVSIEADRFVPVPRDRWKSLRADEQFDAVMYEGPKSSITFAKPAPSLCADPEHVHARLLRIALAGLPPFEAERLKNACAK